MIKFDKLTETDLYHQFILTLPRNQFGATRLDSNQIIVTLTEVDAIEGYARFLSLDETEEEKIYFDEQKHYILGGC